MVNSYITLQASKTNHITIEANQGDESSQKVSMSLLDGSMPVDLTGASVSLRTKKSDGNAILNNCPIIDATNGKAYVILTPQICVLAETLLCEIWIIWSDTTLKIINGLTINVNKTFGVTAIESTEEFTALTTAIATVNCYDSRIAQNTEDILLKVNKSDIVDNLTTGGTTVPASAETVKTLKSITDNLTNGTILTNASKIQGKPVSATAPTANQILQFDGTSYTPTTIVESGSNTNGSYTKFADGTMICTHKISSGVGNTASGAIYISPATTWTFPVAFVGGLPTVNIMVSKMLVSGTNPISVSRAASSNYALTSISAIFVWYDSLSTTCQSELSAIAIGKWK